MDSTWFLYLNGLPEKIPVLGGTAVVLAKYGIIFYVGLICWLWWRGTGAPTERRRLVLLAVLAVALSVGLNITVNVLAPRPRPFLVLPAHVLVSSPPGDPSFPSDHAAVTSSMAITLFLGGQIRWGMLGILGAVLIGLGRVVIGVHYPSDILGGVLIGTASGIVATWAQTRLRPMLDFALEVARRLRLG